MKLSLALIMKDEVKQFQRILASYGSIFDEVVVAVDDRISEFKDVANSYPNIEIKVLPYKWINDFSHKRNFVAYHVTGDMYVRLDSDDAIAHSCVKQVRNIAERAYVDGTTIVFGFYNYSRDEWGNVNASHWREVIIRNTANLYWNKKIHENLLPKNKNEYKIDMHDGLIIEHLATPEHIDKSFMRNMKYLLDEYNQDKENTDSRTLAYLGRMLSGAGNYDKAIIFLEKHIHTSGWDDDRYMSWCQLSDCYRHKKNLEMAKGAAFEALAERPDYPDAYLRLHDIYFDMEDWKKAEEWGRQGLMKPIPKTFMMQDLSSYQWRPILSMSFTLFQLNKFEDALKLFNLAKKDVPTLDFIVKNEGMFNKAVEHRNFMSNFLGVVNYLKEKGEDSKIADLLKSVPEELKENGVVIKLQNHFGAIKEWPSNSACIFAVSSLEDWSPKSSENGIGGSEEAVINLSRELHRLGMEVTVFNNCGEQEGVYDGVIYKNYIKFSPNDVYNIVISWRSNIFENTLNVKKRIVWLHDCPNIDFGEDNIKKVDRIVVLSKYHASMLPSWIPQDKVFISTNGINAEDFIGLDKVSREKHRCIWASSYNRGLEDVLNMWPDIRKEVTDATLHVFYGWDTYDAFVKQGFAKDDGFKARIENLMKQEGVFHHGRVGHKELLVEYAKSEILAYPCNYKGEINCIALTKAIGCGCIPVTNDHEIMKERNPYHAVHNSEFKKVLINTLKHGAPKIDYKKYVQDNSWEAVAKDWKNNLFNFEEPVVYHERLSWIRKQINKDAKIVDIGCNKGHLFAGWDRTNITSVDIDKYDLPNFVQADATKSLPFKDKEFDIAVLGEIIEHVDNPVDVIREVMRVCKKLIMTTPWECRWTSDLMPMATIEERMKVDRVDSRLELAKIANPAISFHTEDNLEHLWHKQFPTPTIMKEWLNKADISEYKLVELRDGNWVNIGVICG